MITKNNILVLDQLLSGKYMQPSFSNAQIKKFKVDTGLSINSAYNTLKKLEEMGIVIGYIPIVTEDGRRMIETMKQMYKMSQEDSLVEMVNDG